MNSQKPSCYFVFFVNFPISIFAMPHGRCNCHKHNVARQKQHTDGISNNMSSVLLVDKVC